MAREYSIEEIVEVQNLVNQVCEAARNNHHKELQIPILEIPGRLIFEVLTQLHKLGFRRVSDRETPGKSPVIHIRKNALASAKVMRIIQQQQPIVLLSKHPILVFNFLDTDDDFLRQATRILRRDWKKVVRQIVVFPDSEQVFDQLVASKPRKPK